MTRRVFSSPVQPGASGDDGVESGAGGRDPAVLGRRLGQRAGVAPLAAAGVSRPRGDGSVSPAEDGQLHRSAGKEPRLRLELPLSVRTGCEEERHQRQR